MPEGRFLQHDEQYLKSYYFRVSGNYNRLIANEHPFNIMAGSEVKSADRQSGFNNGYGFQWDSWRYAFRRLPHHPAIAVRG